MLNYKELSYYAKDPYPEIRVCEKNPSYARLIMDNLGSPHSEMSAVSLYFYNHLLTQEGYQDISYIFHKISIVEMHHLEIWGSIALQLGADPRLWSLQRNRYRYWSPGYNEYLSDLGLLIENSLQGELFTIQTYERQLSCIQDKNIQENLSRIILDEKIHVDIFKMILAEYQL